MAFLVGDLIAAAALPVCAVAAAAAAAAAQVALAAFAKVVRSTSADFLRLLSAMHWQELAPTLRLLPLNQQLGDRLQH